MSLFSVVLQLPFWALRLTLNLELDGSFKLAGQQALDSTHPGLGSQGVPVSYLAFYMVPGARGSHAQVASTL